MNAHGETGDLRAGIEEQRERVATVGRVGLRRKADDAVIGVGRIGPLIGVGPDAELELKATTGSLGGDELERFEIALALAGLECGLDVHLFVPRDLDEIRVREVEVVAGDAAGKVIA